MTTTRRIGKNGRRWMAWFVVAHLLLQVAPHSLAGTRSPPSTRREALDHVRAQVLERVRAAGHPDFEHPALSIEGERQLLSIMDRQTGLSAQGTELVVGWLLGTAGVFVLTFWYAKGPWQLRLALAAAAAVVVGLTTGAETYARVRNNQSGPSVWAVTALEEVVDQETKKTLTQLGEQQESRRSKPAVQWEDQSGKTVNSRPVPVPGTDDLDMFHDIRSAPGQPASEQEGSVR